jgi:hypothetical protein
MLPIPIPSLRTPRRLLVLAADFDGQDEETDEDALCQKYWSEVLRGKANQWAQSFFETFHIESKWRGWHS